jgi:hypothetical protein
MKMQISFIENVFKGLKSPIKLYMIGDEDELADAKIVDGLQRMTALGRFFDNEIKVFGYYAKDYPAGFLRSLGVYLRIEMYRFATLTELEHFYIEMNENITHSQGDIEKAKRYFREQESMK